MTKFIIFIALVGVSIFLIGGWSWLQRQASVSDQDQARLIEDRTCGLPSANSIPADTTVTVTAEGFTASQVEIKVGRTVRWFNQDQSRHRVASDPHPTHDACVGFDSNDLADNQDFSFTFTKAGQWHYHDHHQPDLKGLVVVTD